MVGTQGGAGHFPREAESLPEDRSLLIVDDDKPFLTRLALSLIHI